MIELMKKAMYTGIGMLSLTKDKIEEVARDFVEQGKLSEKEGEKLVQEMLKRSEESRQELKKQIESGVNATVEKMDIASKADIAELKTELAELKSAIKSLHK